MPPALPIPARLDAREQRQLAWSVALLLLVLLAPAALGDFSAFPALAHGLELAISAAFALAAYLCRGGVCGLPITNPAALAQALRHRRGAPS